MYKKIGYLFKKFKTRIQQELFLFQKTSLHHRHDSWYVMSQFEKSMLESNQPEKLEILEIPYQ